MPKCAICHTKDIPHDGACDPCIAVYDLEQKKAQAEQKSVWDIGRMVSPSPVLYHEDGRMYHKHDKTLTQANLSTIETLRADAGKYNIYLYGESGVGKTYLAYLLAEKAFRERGTAIGYLRCSGFQSMAFRKTDEYYRLLGCSLLVVDDIDKLQTFDNSLLLMHEFLDTLRARLIVTGNASKNELTTALLGGKETTDRRNTAIAITSR